MSQSLTQVQTPQVLNYLSRSFEPYEKSGKHYVKVFLIDDSMSLNKWGVTTDAIMDGLRSFIGRPVLGPPGDPNEHGTYKDAAGDLQSFSPAELAAYEQSHKVGTIIEVGQAQDAFGIVEITDDAAWEGIKSGAWMWVSPQIRVDTNNVTQSGGLELVKSFLGRHLAFVARPAFGSQARVKGTCVSPDVRTCNFSAALELAVKEAREQKPQTLDFVASMDELLKDYYAAPASGPGSFPWEQCLSKMMDKYGDKDTAQKVCAAIKNRSVGAAIQAGLAKTVGEAAQLIGDKIQSDKLYAYAWSKFSEADHVKEPPTANQPRMEPAEAEKKIADMKADMDAKCAAFNATIEGLKTKLDVLEMEKAQRIAAEHDKVINRVVELKVQAGLARQADFAKEVEAIKTLSADALNVIGETYQKILAGTLKTRGASTVTFQAAAADSMAPDSIVDELYSSLFGANRGGGA